MKENHPSHHQQDNNNLPNKGVFKKYFVYAIIFFLGVLGLIGIFDSSPTPQDKVKTIDHTGSVETEVKVAHLNNDHDLLTTIHKIWTNGSLVRTYTTTDTLPSLGSITTTAEDANGSSQNVTVPKDYEIYITVK